MTIFNNKEEFKDRPEIYEILTKLEQAHKTQDGLACAVLLTKLKQKNIDIVPEKQ